jgi:hypothetical protein
MPEAAERPDQVLFQCESGVIRPDGDEHRMGLYRGLQALPGIKRER